MLLTNGQSCNENLWGEDTRLPDGSNQTFEEKGPSFGKIYDKAKPENPFKIKRWNPWISESDLQSMAGSTL